jgi:hypothetical protein
MADLVGTPSEVGRFVLVVDTTRGGEPSVTTIERLPVRRGDRVTRARARERAVQTARTRDLPASREPGAARMVLELSPDSFLAVVEADGRTDTLTVTVARVLTTDS